MIIESKIKRKKRMQLKYFIILLFSVFLLLTVACEIEVPELPLTKEEKKAIDSIYIAEKKIIKIDLDSLCDLRFNGFVDHAVDSIMKERKIEIEKLLNRN